MYAVGSDDSVTMCCHRRRRSCQTVIVCNKIVEHCSDCVLFSLLGMPVVPVWLTTALIQVSRMLIQCIRFGSAIPLCKFSKNF